MERRESIGKGILYIIYITLKPIYLRSSGSIQLADAFLILFSFYLILQSKGKVRLSWNASRILKLFLLLVIYQLLVNFIWTVVLGTRLFKPILYYAFNYIALIDFLIVGEEIGYQNVKKSVMIGSLISLIISSIGITFNAATGRGTGFFNNPNQLGYYALILFSCILLCWDWNKPILKWIMIVLSIWLIIASSSKSAFISVVVTAFMYIIFESEDRSIKNMTLKLVALAAVSVMIYLLLFSANSFVLSNRYLFMMRRRIINMSSENDSALGSGRGYSRIWEIGVHFLWGVGEGAYNRFQTMKGMEIHSTFASLLVSYGLTGLIGYALIFFRGIVYRGNAIRNLIVFSGVLLYQVTHNGIRNTLLWLFLALFILHQTTLLSPDCTSLSKRTI